VWLSVSRLNSLYRGFRLLKDNAHILGFPIFSLSIFLMQFDKTLQCNDLL
jgi:hypothetical protein